MPERLFQVPAEFLSTVFGMMAAGLGGVAAFLRARFDGEPFGRSLLLTGIAGLQCFFICVLVIELWPNWSKLAVVVGSSVLGFSPKIALQRIDAMIGAAGRMIKKKIE